MSPATSAHPWRRRAAEHPDLAQFADERLEGLAPAERYAPSRVMVCAAPVTQSIFKVVYEQGGRQYSVQLPHDPGEFITLQLPEMPTAPAPIVDAQQISTTAPLPATVPTAVISPFPAVLFMGATYASFPYLGPRRIQGWSGGMRGRMGGRRH